MCENYYKTKVDLNVHLYEIHGSECADYNKYFGSNISRDKSMKKLDWKSVIPNEDGRINCFDCQKTFSSIQTAKVHYQMMHMGEKEFDCEICNKHFNVKSNLSKHIRGKYYS